MMAVGDVIESLIPNVAGWLGVEPSTALLIFGVSVTACNLIGRAIPDDKTGVLGTVRDVCKWVGLYAPNRITSGVNVNDVARHVVGVAEEKGEDIVADLAKKGEALIPQVVDDVLDRPVPPFPGHPNPDDKYLKG
jgi:hypothetical protein